MKKYILNLLITNLLLNLFLDGIGFLIMDYVTKQEPTQPPHLKCFYGLALGLAFGITILLTLLNTSIFLNTFEKIFKNKIYRIITFFLAPLFFLLYILVEPSIMGIDLLFLSALTAKYILTLLIKFVLFERKSFHI